MFEQIRLQIRQFIYFLLQVCLLVYLKGETLLDTPWTYDFLKKAVDFSVWITLPNPKQAKA